MRTDKGQSEQLEESQGRVLKTREECMVLKQHKILQR